MANHQYTVFENETKSLFYIMGSEASFVHHIGRENSKSTFLVMSQHCGSHSIILTLIFNANFLVIEHTV